MAAVRAFLAVEIPDSVREPVSRLIERLRGSVDGVKWEKPRNLHVTMKFYGDVEEDVVPVLTEGLRGAVAGLGAIPLEFAGAGAFPKPRTPRVIWVGLGGDDGRLTAAAVRVEEVSEALGYARERRPFHPHMTIGRVRPGRRPPDMTTRLSEAAGRRFGDFTVSSLTLMRSELTPTGSIYTPLAAIPLIG